MKKLLSMLCCAIILCGCFGTVTFADEGSAERKGQSEGVVTIDSITSASVQNAFANKGLTGDELMDAINNKGGVTVMGTCDAEGTVNLAVLEWFMAKKDDVYYVAVNMMPNQTSANVDSGSDVVFLYANMDNPYEGETRELSTCGAKIITEIVEDQDLVDELCISVGKRPKGVKEGLCVYAFKVIEVRPLG